MRGEGKKEQIFKFSTTYPGLIRKKFCREKTTHLYYTNKGRLYLLSWHGDRWCTLKINFLGVGGRLRYVQTRNVVVGVMVEDLPWSTVV